MKSIIPILIFTFISSLPATCFADPKWEAKSWHEEIQCGNAIIDMEMIEGEPGIKIWEVELKIKSKFKKTASSILNYEQVYFNYSCEKTASGKDYFVFQAYCSGSGCFDKDNWGIVNNYGQLILAPYNKNSEWKDSILKEN